MCVCVCNKSNSNVDSKNAFQQKNKYKGTLQHSHSKHWHMIDYIIVRHRDLQDL